MSQAAERFGGMSVLRENQCYGLSSGKLSGDGGSGGGGGNNVSVFHVKLTDSAARAIGTFQSGKGWSSHPTICFSGDYGRIAIPCSENQEEARIFTFGLTNVARDNPHGSFDCVEQLSSGAAEELSCLGVIQKKMTVNATDDSYDKARQSMAQAEEETRSRGAIVIKHGGRFQGKKVTVRPPGPALASLSKPKQPSSSSLLANMRRGVGASKLRKGAGATHRKSVSDVQDRPLGERVTHLLALRPYKRPELILRLQKDGLKGGDKEALESVLLEVGQLNSRDNTFVLKDSLYKDLRKDWPGYTTGDQQLLKRILVRRLFQPQQNLLAVPEAQVSPLRDTPNSSPAHRSKLPPPEEYTDPLASKKPRISHLSSKAGGDKSRPRPSEAAAHKVDVEATADDGKRNSVDHHKLFESLSAVCQQEAEAAKRLQPTDTVAQKGQKGPKEPSQADSERSPSPLIVPRPNRQSSKRKKSKHKEHEKERWKEKKERKIAHSSELGDSKVSRDCTEPSENLFDSKELQADDDTPDYFLKYGPICSHSQRQSYKQDFNNEYSEYRDLHACIDSATRQFMELDTQLKQLPHESHKYKTVRNQILQEYRKIKKSNPNYTQDKIRCEYLHNKLAHIKKLISDYDQQQLRADRSCPK